MLAICQNLSLVSQNFELLTFFKYLVRYSPFAEFDKYKDFWSFNWLKNSYSDLF